MSEKFEAIGIWWSPENPKKMLHGTLSYGPETGAILQIAGSFETLDKATIFLENDSINGFAGIEITSYKCFTQSVPIFFFNPDTISIVYFVNVIKKIFLGGYHFE